MRNFISILFFIVTIILSILSIERFNTNILYLMLYVYGFVGGVILCLFKLNKKNSAINSYKRELEKESINSDENYAKVKVLESKIAVLEKALHNALENK